MADINWLSTPPNYDRCNAKFSILHVLSCKLGGLVHAYYDEGRDALRCMAYTSFKYLMLIMSSLSTSTNIVNITWKILS